MPHEQSMTSKCPSCAVNNALALKGWKVPEQASCKTCKGTGEIAAHKPSPDRRRKDMSGEEWTEHDARWERERERMEREE